MCGAICLLYASRQSRLADLQIVKVNFKISKKIMNLFKYSVFYTKHRQETKRKEELNTIIYAFYA